MTYPETVQYLESFINYEKIPAYPYKESLKLERIKNFLATINDPQDALRCIHIAGTKGKGSTSVFIAYILREAGYNVGLYTSPHLADFRERIRILRRMPHAARQEFEGMIAYDELNELVEKLRPAIQTYNKNSEYGPLSFFEVYTSLAFVYFKEKKVDFTVLETGLGGRLDATNAVFPLVSAITPISYEHTQKLGNTLIDIAAEKAGIIKVSTRQSPAANPIVISAPQEEEAMGVIRSRCNELGVKLYEVDRDILYEKAEDGFSVKGIFGEYQDLKIRLLGRHQLINATVAVGIIDALRFYNITVGIDAVRGGLHNTVWPGRCEIISKDPLIVLDGAQNVASIRTLKETVREEFKYKRLILILGISSDKDIEGMCREIYDLIDEVVLTQANSPRATKPEILAQYFNGKTMHKTADVKEAKDLARSIAQTEDLILVTGSLFVVGECRALFKAPD